ncbi:gp58-like family protein [Oceanobacillus sp. FSL H7-0719]|uniref:gp58-like family protein n=1 Tax=Oceanobacillus sp. FSL H7-0719 TaxID=2954507 RepID=UPI00324EF141
MDEINKLREEMEILKDDLDVIYSYAHSLERAFDTKVSRNEIISAINLSKEGVRIAGDKIHLDGETLIDK